MSREQIYAEMEGMMGLVPGFFKGMPDSSLESEWALFKRYALSSDGPFHPKYRELIGIGSAAARQCWYCVNFHTALARFHGATAAEIEEAIHLACFGGGWSSYLHGLGYDQERFLRELAAIGEFLSDQ